MFLWCKKRRACTIKLAMCSLPDLLKRILFGLFIPSDIASLVRLVYSCKKNQSTVWYVCK